MFSQIKSFFLYIGIQIDRIVDHSFRYLFGLPRAKMSMVTPDVYLGGQYNARSIYKLKKLGITGIVNMREISVHKENEAEQLGIRILNLPTPDKSAPSIEQLEKGVKFIEDEIKNKGKVYIHCYWGEERGPTMTIAYLIKTGLTFDAALATVRKVRTFVRPVPAQIERLKEFEKKYVKTD